VFHSTTQLRISPSAPSWVFHALVVALVQLALLAVEDLGRQGVPAFLQVAHGLDVAPVGLLGGQGADMQCLGDAAVGGDRLPERGGVPVALQHADHVVGADLAGVDRHDHAQDVGL
jgi:hypothetical protein